MAYTVGATSTDKKTMESTARTNHSGNITTYGNGVSVHTRATAPNAAPAATGLVAGGAVPAAAAAAKPVNAAPSMAGLTGTGAAVALGSQVPPVNPDGVDSGSGSGSDSGGGGYRSGGSSGGYSGGASYAAPTLPTATDQSEYIRSMYDANERAARENLRAEYENNIAALDRALAY